MQTTMLKKKVEEPTLETINPRELVNNGPLQVRMVLEDLRHGRVKIFDPAALKRSRASKKTLETMRNVDKNDRLYKLMGSAKPKKLTKEQEEKKYEDYEHRDLSYLFRKYGLD